MKGRGLFVYFSPPHIPLLLHESILPCCSGTCMWLAMVADLNLYSSIDLGMNPSLLRKWMAVYLVSFLSQQCPENSKHGIRATPFGYSKDPGDSHDRFRIHCLQTDPDWQWSCKDGSEGKTPGLGHVESADIQGRSRRVMRSALSCLLDAVNWTSIT